MEEFTVRLPSTEYKDKLEFMQNPSSNQRIVLTESQFEYFQQMLDYGSPMRQALLEVCPELQGIGLDIKDKVIMVQRASLSSETL